MSSLLNETQIPNIPVPPYEYITREEDAKRVFSELEKYSVLEVDTEGTSLDPFSCRTTLLQIGVPNKSYVFDVRSDLPDVDIHGSLFEPILSNKTQLKILQNANYDLKVLKVQFGYYIENIYDLMIAEQLMYLGIQVSGFSLARMTEKYLGMRMDKEPRGTFSLYEQDFTDEQLGYAAKDVCIMDLIRNLQKERIQEYGLQRALELEMKFIKPLAEMELNGIKLDTERWRIMMKEFEKESIELRKTIEDSLQSSQDQLSLFGLSVINIDSPSQLLKALNKLGLSLESTSVDVLKKYEGHPAIDALLDYRKKAKLINTYGEALIDKIHPKTNRLHTRFKQMVSTGRLSSNDPNLQNIPGKQKFRSCFVTDEGKALVTVDQDSAELVIMGDMSGEPNFIDTYNKKLDLHTVNAARVYNVPYEEVTSDQRKASKAISFGLCLPSSAELVTSIGTRSIAHVEVGNRVAHDIGADEIIDKKFMGEKECFKIETKYGYTLETTEEHEVKVIDASGTYVDKKLKDIDTATDHVCLKKGANMFSKKLYRFDTRKYDSIFIKKAIELPKYMDENLAKFLGTFVSEGSLGKDLKGEYNSINFGFSDSVEEYLVILEDIFSKIFDNISRLKYGHKVEYNLCSKKYAAFIADICGVIKDTSKTINIAVPTCIKESPKDIQAAFISALYEGDGTIYTALNRSQIEYSTMSLPLCRDLQHMLLNFGILSSHIQCFDKRYPNRAYYKIIIIGEDSRRIFMENIGFLTRHKNNKYVYVDNTTEKEFPSFSIPNQGKLLNSIIHHIHDNNYNQLRQDLSGTTFKHRDCYRIGHRLLSWCRSSLNNGDGLNKVTEKQLEAFRVYDEQLDFLYSNSIVPLPIKKIESTGVKPVYDISVSNRELFLANGFVVHNCYGISAVGLGKRLGITKDKAQDLINTYFKVNNTLYNWLTNSAKQAIREHSSTTITGRRRFYNIPPMSDPGRKKILGSVERASKNHRIQGCLVRGTCINGLGPIEKYVEKSVELSTGFGKDKAVGVYSGKKEAYNLKLSNGTTLGITLNHKIPVATEKGIIDKEVKDLRIGKDKLMVPLEVQEGTVTKFDYEGYSSEGNPKEYKLPEEMSPKLAFLLGCMIGDGCYSDKNTVRFCCCETSEELFKKFNTYSLDILNYAPKLDRVLGHRKLYLDNSSIHSVTIRDFIKYIGLDFVVGKDKSIPSYFFTETIENRGALLNGLFSTDGGVTRTSGPNYTTVSKQLAEDIHNLLFTLGINSNLKTYEEDGDYVYRIQIPKRFNEQFKKLVGFSSDFKNDLLDEVIASTNTTKDISEVPSFIPKLIEKGLRNSSRFENLSYNDKAHLRRFKSGSCSYGSWRKFYHMLPECEEKQVLSKYVNYDFCTPVDIEYRGIEDTYDLMCDNIHYFTANGVIVHNSDSDTIKEAMILCVDKLEELNVGAKLLLSVHDEIVVETPLEHVDIVAKAVTEAVDEGFNKYFHRMPMYTDPVIGPCWIKGECENKIEENGKTKECGHNVMEFVKDETYGTRLVCGKCGASQE